MDLGEHVGGYNAGDALLIPTSVVKVVLLKSFNPDRNVYEYYLTSAYPDLDPLG